MKVWRTKENQVKWAPAAPAAGPDMSHYKPLLMLSMEAHTWDPSTWKVEAEGAEVQGQPGLYEIPFKKTKTQTKTPNISIVPKSGSVHSDTGKPFPLSSNPSDLCLKRTL